MPGRGKKTNKRGLVKNLGFRRDRGSSSESEQDGPAPDHVVGDVHQDEVLELHDQLEQGELIEESDSDGQVPLARGIQRVNGAQAQGQLEKEVAPYIWKKEGLRLQNDIAVSAVNKLDNALTALDLQHYNRVRYNINAAVAILKKRMKELRIADTSESGWETVNAYKANPIAEDSDDDKRLQRAEKVAKECVAAKTRKSKFGGRGHFYRRGYWNCDDSDNQRYFPYRNNGSGKSQDQQQRNGYVPNHRRRQNFNLCFYCGQTGHWQNECPNKGEPKKED